MDELDQLLAAKARQERRTLVSAGAAGVGIAALLAAEAGWVSRTLSLVVFVPALAFVTWTVWLAYRLNWRFFKLPAALQQEYLSRKRGDR